MSDRFSVPTKLDLDRVLTSWNCVQIFNRKLSPSGAIAAATVSCILHIERLSRFAVDKNCEIVHISSSLERFALVSMFAIETEEHRIGHLRRLTSRPWLDADDAGGLGGRRGQF